LRPQDLIDAMDGVTLLLDRRLEIVALGRPGWLARLAAQGAPAVPPAAMLGRPLLDCIAPGATRDALAAALDQVLAAMRPFIRLDHRCDSASVRRSLRLAVTPVAPAASGAAGGAVARPTHLLYQSTVLEETGRPALPLHDAPAGGEAPDSEAPDSAGIVTLCSVCARIAWPAAVAADRCQWIDAVDYYQRGGAPVARLSHGLCPPCFDVLLQEVDGPA